MSSFTELKKLIKYMKVFGFTREGRRYWFNRNSGRIGDKLARFTDKLRRGEASDFIYDEATQVRHSILTEEFKKYLLPDLEKESRAKVLDDFAWMTGTGSYAQ